MNQLRIHPIMYIFIIIFCTACETMISNVPLDELPQEEPKLVVHSIISPQLEYINVVVTRSIPLFSNPDKVYDPVENAIVEISDGINKKVIPFNETEKIYSIKQSDFPIADSKKYILKVSDGKSEVTAECVVPKPAPAIKSYTFDTLVFNYTEMIDTSVTLRFDWHDIQTDTNYYHLNAVMNVEYNIAQKERAVHKFNYLWNWKNGSSEFQSDKNQDGSLMNSPMGKLQFPSAQKRVNDKGEWAVVQPNCTIKDAMVELYNIDVNYYKYQNALTLRNESNVFAEPSTIYSNIQGGYGCFGAYTASQIKIKY